jgi:formylmethanofuran dehydrogenase subunit E
VTAARKAREAANQTTLKHVACDECGEMLPIGVSSAVENGDLVIRPDLSDVSAHAWQHEAAR